jgi:hypothetical protein
MLAVVRIESDNPRPSARIDRYTTSSLPLNGAASAPCTGIRYNTCAPCGPPTMPVGITALCVVWSKSASGAAVNRIDDFRDDRRWSFAPAPNAARATRMVGTC